MSKNYKIRWKQDDEKRLAKAVKNFNAKRTRLIKKDPNMEYVLPEKANTKKLKDLIATRQDLNREIKSLERFTKTNRGKTKSGKAKAQPHDIITIPGNKYNLKVTRWQYNEMKRSKAYIDAKRQERHDALYNTEQTDRGTPLGYTAGQIGMGRADTNALKPIQLFPTSMNRKDFLKKFKTIMKERQSDYWDKQELEMKASYIKGLTENYRYEDMKEVIEHIEKLPFKEFYDVYKRDQTIFEYASDLPNDTLYKGYVNKIYATWMPSRGPKLEEAKPEANAEASTRVNKQSSEAQKVQPDNIRTARSNQQPQHGEWTTPNNTQNRPFTMKKKNDDKLN